MLSYRHAFHAGNHADVLKHFVLMQTLAYATQKDKPLWYVDTHAGAGMYALDSTYASQNAEYETGIQRLWQRDDLPESIASYVNLIRHFNPNGKLKLYPGSPACARELLRAEDRLRLYELHPTDQKLLKQSMGKSRQILIEVIDGFTGLKASVPPPSRRAVVLIDPPYELKQDYQHVVTAMKEALQRFSTGTYIIWYPLLQRPEPLQMVEKLKKIWPESWLNVSLSVEKPALDGFGMYGSGLFIINPPWTLPGILEEALPVLLNALKKDEGAGYTLQKQIS